MQFLLNRSRSALGTQTWLLGLTFSAICFPILAAEPVPPSTAHVDVSYFIDASGNRQPVRTKDDWNQRRQQITRGVELAMGKFPTPKKSVPLDVQVIEEMMVGKLLRKKLSYQTDSTERRITAYLFLPAAAQGDKKLPAVLCLHQTNNNGKGEPAGLGGNPNLYYALELAERGFVTLAPDYPSFGEYRYDFPADDGYESGSMKAIYENTRAIDLLVSLPFVDASRIGSIGHSLGGHNTIFTMFFEQRIKAGVSCCGFTRAHKYYDGDLKGWTSKRYMPKIDTLYGCNPDRIPFDFPELIAGLAPRAFLTVSPLHDDNFEVSGVRDTIALAQSIYDLLGAKDSLAVIYPDCKHDFPPDARETAYLFLEKHLGKP